MYIQFDKECKAARQNSPSIRGVELPCKLIQISTILLVQEQVKNITKHNNFLS